MPFYYALLCFNVVHGDDSSNCSTQVEKHRGNHTLTAVTILRQLQACSTAPAGVGSRAVQTQLARAHVSHQALIHIWTEKHGHIIAQITISGFK